MNIKIKNVYLRKMVRMKKKVCDVSLILFIYIYIYVIFIFIFIFKAFDRTIISCCVRPPKAPHASEMSRLRVMY